MATKKRTKMPMTVSIDHDLIGWLEAIAELAHSDLDTVVSTILAMEVISSREKIKKPAKLK